MSSPSGASFSLRCLIYKVHAVPGGTLLLYSISFRLSRTFFRSFLTSDPSRISSNLFRLPHLSLAVKNFFHLFPARLITAPTALLEYQILPLLSIPFFTFPLILYSASLPLESALLYYHIPPPLSTTFLYFFFLFITIFAIIFISALPVSLSLLSQSNIIKV